MIRQRVGPRGKIIGSYLARTGRVGTMREDNIDIVQLQTFKRSLGTFDDASRIMHRVHEEVIEVEESK